MSLDVYLMARVDLGGREPREFEIYWDNYTSNVWPMWEKAGVYEALNQSDGKEAGEIVETLKRGVAAMEADPDGFSVLNPENGWGSYGGALRFLQNYAEACAENPKAIVRVS